MRLLAIVVVGTLSLLHFNLYCMGHPDYINRCPALSIHEAILYGTATDVKHILDEHPEEVNAPNNTALLELCGGFSPLALAAFCGKVKKARILIKHAAQVNPKTGNPLAEAVKNRNIKVIKLLLNHGATITANALLNTSCNGDIKISELLLKQGANINTSMLLNAVSYDRKAYVLWLLKQGVNLFEGLTFPKGFDYLPQENSPTQPAIDQIIREWRKAPLTLCCGLHQRCGAKSNFRFLNQYLIQEIIKYLWPEVLKK